MDFRYKITFSILRELVHNSREYTLILTREIKLTVDTCTYVVQDQIQIIFI